MKRNPLVVVVDIIAAIDGIAEATKGKTFAEFQADWLLRHGVQRGIEIISEAVRHLPSEMAAAYPDLPWPRIRAVGNVLRHEYHRIADDIVWNMVRDDLPVLERVMQTIRRDLLSDTK